MKVVSRAITASMGLVMETKLGHVLNGYARSMQKANAEVNS